MFANAWLEKTSMNGDSLAMLLLSQVVIALQKLLQGHSTESLMWLKTILEGQLKTYRNHWNMLQSLLPYLQY